MRAIAIIRDNPGLTEFLTRLQTQRDRYEERAKFLKKQRDNLKEECAKVNELLWSELEEFLAKQGMLPSEYKKDTHSLHIDENASLLYMSEKNSDGGMPKGLKEFLQSLGINT